MRAIEGSASFGTLRQESPATVSLLCAQLLTRLGDAVFLVCVAAFAVRASDVSIIAWSATGQLIGTLLMLPATAILLERLGPKRTLLVADGVRAAALVALFEPGLQIHSVFLCVGLVLGLGDGLSEPALTVGLRELLPTTLLLVANSANSVCFRIAALVGPLIGSAILFASFSVSVVINLVSFAASFMLVACSTWPPRTAGASAGSTRRGSVVAYLRSNAWVGISILTFALVYSFGVAPMRVLIPAFLQETGQPSSMLGLLLTVQALGALVGSLAARSMVPRCRPGVMIFVGVAIVGTAMALLPHPGLLLAAAACSAIFGVALAIASVAWATLVQRNVPVEILGRVSSIDWMTSLSLSPAVLLVLPHILKHATAASILTIFGSIVVVVSGVALSTLPVRRLELK